MKKLILISISVLLFWSCDKKHITGTIKDNFGNPIEEVLVFIDNTNFKTYSGRNGGFSLDYAPGEIDLTIEKEGYTNIKHHLSISEKSKYPLQETMLVKIPEKKGVFLISLNNYTEVPKSKLNLKNEPKKDSHGNIYVDGKYYINKDSILVIPGMEEDKYVFIENSGLELKLVKVEESFKAANFQVGMSSLKVITEYCNEEVINITADIRERKVVLEKGQVYAFLNIIDLGFYQKMSNVSFAFKIE